MDKQGKEHDLDKTRRWVEESNITMPPERKSGNERTEKRTTTSTTNEFEKHPYEEGLNGVVGRSIRKDMIDAEHPIDITMSRVRSASDMCDIYFTYTKVN